MALVVVQIETDHEDIEEAARSVMNGMKRAGYEHRAHNISEGGFLGVDEVKILLEYAEPEVLDRAKA